ncbi:hypothetical protein ONJ16_25300, partial [Salmonella enterica subsp. enterica serovar Montevideo]|nr:hypothetical protein [Salmonella enterica subsp. enterica serovar Montevideo]
MSLGISLVITTGQQRSREYELLGPHYTHYPSRCLFVNRFRPPYSHTFTYDRDDIDLRPEY